MKIVAIIQARMGSARLPGKVMKDLQGDTVLARVVSRIRRSQLIDRIVIATTDATGDDVIVRECKRIETDLFRGSEDDVLDRYYGAAASAKADVIVRITSDCPLIDPVVSDQTIACFLRNRPDYASNTLERTYPRGLDTEVIAFEALERAWREGGEPHHREHVTPYIYQSPGLFRTIGVKGDVDYSGHRWTLDTEEDFQFIQAIYERFRGRDDFSWRQVLRLVEEEPQLALINSHIVQKALRNS